MITICTVGLQCDIKYYKATVLKVAGEKYDKISQLLPNIVVLNTWEYLRFLLSKTTLSVCERETEIKGKNVCH